MHMRPRMFKLSPLLWGRTKSTEINSYLLKYTELYLKSCPNSCTVNQNKPTKPARLFQQHQEWDRKVSKCSRLQNKRNPCCTFEHEQNCCTWRKTWSARKQILWQEEQRHNSKNIAHSRWIGTHINDLTERCGIWKMKSSNKALLINWWNSPSPRQKALYFCILDKNPSYDTSDHAVVCATSESEDHNTSSIH